MYDTPLYPVQTWNDALLTAMARLLGGVMAILPSILGALIIILLGYVVANLCKQVTLRLFRTLRLDRLTDSIGLNGFLTRAGFGITAMEAVAQAVRWFVLISFILAGLAVLGLPAVTDVLNGIINYIPKVVAAVLILAGGLLLANFLADVLRGSLKSLRFDMADMMASVAKWILVVFTILAVIRQLEIVPDLINILFTGFVGAIALAMGLAFGLGGKDVANEMMREWYESWKRMNRK